MQHFRGHIQTKNGHTCRKRRSNFTCTRPTEASAPDSHVCSTSIDTPKTTARFDVQHISNGSDVSRVLSLTAAADAHMQSWTAVMLDRKREKTAVRFDVHISETKTRPCSRLWLPCQKRWSILACACFSYFFPSSFFIFYSSFFIHSTKKAKSDSFPLFLFRKNKKSAACAL